MAELSPRRAFVAGWPIAHSRSPLIHGHWLKILGLAGTYEKIALEPVHFAAFINDLESGTSGYVGGNVTIPHKEEARRLVTHCDETADLIGAVNTLYRDDKGELHGTNTDAYGFSANLDEQVPGWDDQKTAVVYGAGGASRAVIHALKGRGFSDIRIVNRTVERARDLRDRFGEGITAHPLASSQEVLSDAGLFVNTTSLGMDGAEAPTLDFSVMKPGSLVTDIVYVPLRTPFLEQASKAGLKTADGLGMLLHQAVPGFERWFGTRPVVTAQLRQIIIDDMENHA